MEQVSPQAPAQTPCESEAVLHSFYESAPMIMGVVEVWDDDILHVSGNAAAARFMRVAPEALKSRTVSELGVPPERIREWIGHYESAARTRTPVRFEYQSAVAPDPRWMAATVTFMDYTDTGHARCSYIIEDITAYKQALWDSEHHLRLFMAEAIPQIVWTADAEGKLDYYNQRWREYTGLTPEQTTDQSWKESFHPDDLQPALEAWRESVRTGNLYAMEHRIRSKEGAYCWFLTRAVAMRDEDGRVARWFGTATDIDEQKRTAERERLLNELGERMRATKDPQEVLWAAVSMVGEHLQTSRCYYTDTDVDADRAVIHRDYCRGVASWAGTYKLSAFGGQVLVELSQGKTVAIADTMTDPRTAAHYETTYLPTNMRAYLAVPLMQNGKRVATLVVNHSHAPRVWTAEEISLLETVAERTRMAVENARLWQAERERSEQLTLAIAEVHHRVKNSLQGVSALLEMQLPFDEEMMPVQTVREGLNQIKTIALVHDLLARDRPIGDVDAAQVLTKLIELLAAGMQTAERPAPIRVQAEQVWIPTKAATALALTINELVSNAAKHSRPTNREDSNSHDAIEVRLTKHEGEVRVFVQDNGPGFPPGFNPMLRANVGLELVLTLVRHDLHGSIAFGSWGEPDANASAHGGVVEIRFGENVPTE